MRDAVYTGVALQRSRVLFISVATASPPTTSPPVEGRGVDWPVTIAMETLQRYYVIAGGGGVSCIARNRHYKPQIEEVRTRWARHKTVRKDSIGYSEQGHKSRRCRYHRFNNLYVMET